MTWCSYFKISLVARCTLLLLTAKILLYKLENIPVVEFNVVTVADGVFNDGNCAFPELFISHDEAELDVFMWPKTELLL